MGCKCTKEEEETGEYRPNIEENALKVKNNLSISNINENTTPNEVTYQPEQTDKEDVPPMLNYDISILRKKKKKKIKESCNQYDDEIIKLLNLARTKPLNYCKNIDYCITLITTNFEGQLVLGREDTNKIGLKEGISKFNECKRYLIQTDSCKPLEIDDDLCIEIPDDTQLWLDHEYIRQQIVDKQNEILNETKKNYSLFGFHFDYGLTDPTLSSVLQIVDDNNCENRRRFNILNPEYKAIGVTYKQIGKKFISYFFFAG